MNGWWVIDRIKGRRMGPDPAATSPPYRDRGKFTGEELARDAAARWNKADRAYDDRYYIEKATDA